MVFSALFVDANNLRAGNKLLNFQNDEVPTHEISGEKTYKRIVTGANAQWKPIAKALGRKSTLPTQ